MEPPSPSDPPAVLLEKARHFHALARERGAVIERTRAYFAVMKTDKRMRVMAEIVEREIERYEKEEAARSRDARG